MRNVFIEMEKLSNPASGLGQFCMHLGEQFQKINPQDISLNFYVPSSQKNAFGNEFNYVNKNAIHKFLSINSSKYEVWHCLHQGSSYLPSNKSTKLILTIHDLNFLEKYTGLKRSQKLKNLQKLADRATAITVISKFTEKITRENLDIKIPIHVIYNGNSLKKSTKAPSINIPSFKNYFFCIGIISEKKNFHALLSLLENFPDMHLVIAGNNSSGYATHLTNKAIANGTSNRLHLTGSISENDKYHLYKNCTALLFPSLAEGFGLPVIEAMSLGKPVFLSNLTSLPEVGGHEAYYWNNFEASHMADVVKKGLADYETDASKPKRLMEWAEKFSWEKAAHSYIELYRTV